jgi:hypothetical protein
MVSRCVEEIVFVRVDDSAWGYICRNVRMSFPLLKSLYISCVGMGRARSVYDWILSCWMFEIIGRACLELGLAWHGMCRRKMT